MKSLEQFVIEKLKVKKAEKEGRIKVKTEKELKDIIRKRYAENSEYVNLSDIDTSEMILMNSMFSGMVKMKTLDVSGWDTSNVVSMQDMFYGCNALGDIIGIDEFDFSSCEDMRRMFAKTGLERLDTERWNMSSVKNMSYMFGECNMLTNIIGIEDWDVSSAEDISGMFEKCNALQKLDLSKWNVQNVIKLYYMFSECTSLKELDLSNWDFKSKSTFNMFNVCTGLTKLNLTGFNVKGLKDMRYMFYRCESLKSIIGDIEDWNVATVNMFEGMFESCFKLELDLSKWNISNAADITYMTKGSKNIKLPKL